LFNLFGFRELSQLNENERFLIRKYQGCDNGFEIIVKSMKVPVCNDIAYLDRTIENLMNLRHPCISGPIGVVLRSPLQELPIVGQYCSGNSLSEVISTSPEWWTPTAKVKVIVGIVLSMRFAHSFGLLHGHLTGDNVLFDEDGLIQICNFCEKSVSGVAGNSEVIAEVGGFSGECWRPTADVRAFEELLSKIVIGDSAEERGRNVSVPKFVLEMIERGQCSDPNAKLSFVDIFEILKDNDFGILEGVDSKAVSNFVSWIEFTEALTE
jgi:serine/threonine protein kinase